MKTQKLLFVGLLLGTAALVGARPLLDRVPADLPEPASAMLGAGALLVVLGLVRRKQKP